MTSRFFRHAISWESYADATGLVPPEGVEPPEPRANVPPGAWAPVIHRTSFGARELRLSLMYWGLVPGWWNKPLSEKRWTSFNARSEDIRESPTFRGGFSYRRCLIPVSGFFVWSGSGAKRTPMAISVKETDWFALAGIWECWGHDGSEIDTFAVLTVDANDTVAAHATRMPVILTQRQFSGWLDGGVERAERLCQPFRDDLMEEWPVDPAIGDVSVQDFSLIAR